VQCFPHALHTSPPFLHPRLRAGLEATLAARTAAVTGLTASLQEAHAVNTRLSFELMVARGISSASADAAAAAGGAGAGQ